MTAITLANVKKLEKTALNKYEDLLDTVLVLEAMKAQSKKGKSWKGIRRKLMKNV